ncbi:MAG: hypothetical protein Q7S43_04280 [bacterium]|nr:hypothetical protein [bacterium]
MSETVAIWTDELGHKVEMVPFFSQLYVDRETGLLNFSWTDYPCKQVFSSLGRAESEFIAVKILSLAKINRGWCGVAEDEFVVFLRRSGEQWFIPDLIKQGYLRRKMIMGTAVLFPTEKLLHNQNVPHRT